MQLQKSFQNVPLGALCRLGLGVFGLVPDFRQECPLCRGANCVVRHGLYFRRVVDLGGCDFRRFPVPRFRCRRRGPYRSKDRTFSVLPTSLVPRRRLSLPLMLEIVALLASAGTVPALLDRLAALDRGPDGVLLFEETTIYRLRSLLARAPHRLGGWPRSPQAIPASTGVDRDSLCRSCQSEPQGVDDG